MDILWGVIVLIMLLPYVLSEYQYRFDYDWSEKANGWLKYHWIPAVWEEARLRCHAEGAVLASPINERVKSATIAYVREQRSKVERLTPNLIFTGVHATISKGDYSSVEGVPLLRMPIVWAPDEPDNFDNSESCLAMLTIPDGEMSDTSCIRVLPYVCYKSLVVDGTEVKITNLTETDCGTADKDYKYIDEVGTCYKFHKSGLIWSQAQMTCFGEGGHLAVLDDDLEATVVMELYQNKTPNTILSAQKNNFLIGFFDWGHVGAQFMTIHGQTLEETFGSWLEGEPDVNTVESGPHCGSLFRNDTGMWFTHFYCTVPSPFICEKKPRSLEPRFNFLEKSMPIWPTNVKTTTKNVWHEITPYYQQETSPPDQQIPQIQTPSNTSLRKMIEI